MRTLIVGGAIAAALGLAACGYDKETTVVVPPDQKTTVIAPSGDQTVTTTPEGSTVVTNPDGTQVVVPAK